MRVASCIVPVSGMPSRILIARVGVFFRCTRIRFDTLGVRVGACLGKRSPSDHSRSGRAEDGAVSAGGKLGCLSKLLPSKGTIPRLVGSRCAYFGAPEAEIGDTNDDYSNHYAHYVSGG